MMQDMWNAPPGFRPTKSAPTSPAKPLGVSRTRSESFHAIHKVPVGDSPYVRAKNVQLVDKDPEKAIPLFWAAINAGDRVDSALKDMAIVMKQQNRADEAIEAIKSLRHRCSDQAQESLDNILLDLYKRCGRLDDQIALLKHKLYLIQQGLAFNGKRTKTARSQGKKFQVLLALYGCMGRVIMSQWLRKIGLTTLGVSEWNELTRVLRKLLHSRKHIWKDQINFLDNFSGKAKFAWMLNHDTSNAIKMELRKKGHFLMVNKPLYKAKMIHILGTVIKDKDTEHQKKSSNAAGAMEKDGGMHECLGIDSTHFDIASSEESDTAEIEMGDFNSPSTFHLRDEQKE